MYVSHEVFGQEAVIFPVNEKDGNFFLRSILPGGNFGKYNKHYRSIMNGNKAIRGLKKSLFSQIAFFSIFLQRCCGLYHGDYGWPYIGVPLIQ